MKEINNKNTSQNGLLSSTSVCIFGLGLMGGSLALALKGKCREIIAIDPDKSVLENARISELVDHTSSAPDERLNSAGLVVMAAPVNTIINLLQALPDLHTGSPVVMDLGSTKTAIMDQMADLPSRFDPIGGHPICGKEKSTFENAESDLYSGAAFGLFKLDRTSNRAILLARQVVEAVGAVPFWMDASTHDLITASTSHLPYLTAIALAQSTQSVSGPLVGPGLRGSTRLAGSDIQMMIDIIKTNRINILKSLEEFSGLISTVIHDLKNDDEQAVFEHLSAGFNAYKNIISTEVNHSGGSAGDK